MTLPVALFAAVATATAVSAVGVVVSTRVVRAAVWLLFTLVGVAALYLLLGAEFVGAAHLMVYVGGTLVLVVFGVMLTAGGPGQSLRTRPLEWAVGAVLGVALFGLLANAAAAVGLRHAGDAPLPGVGPLGLAFLGVPDPTARSPVAYLLPFEVVSVYLLVVLVGAAYLARAKRQTGGDP